MKREAQRNFITQGQFLEITEKLTSRLDELEFENHNLRAEQDRVNAMRVPLSEIASSAGKLLRVQRSTKPFRTRQEIGAVRGNAK